MHWAGSDKMAIAPVVIFIVNTILEIHRILLLRILHKSLNYPKLSGASETTGFLGMFSMVSLD